MTKIYTIMTFLILGFSFAQTPIITTIIDGDCSGGTPKLLEIYAKGTVDFSMYSIENQNNENTTWSNTTDLSSFGIITNDFVYITTSSSEAVLESEFPTAVGAPLLVSGVINLNGDDRIRLIETETSIVIDQFGFDGIDGTDTLWEYKDSYARRVNETLPDGTFSLSNWFLPGAAVLNGLGVCQGESETFENIIGGLGNYNAILSNNHFKSSEISLFPNPAKNIVNIRTKSDSPILVSVYNLTGKKILSSSLVHGRLDISNLSRGIYLLNFYQNKTLISKKLIIE